MTTSLTWMKAKWAALSRLPADYPSKQTYLPFTDEHSRLQIDEKESQEAKMLAANQQRKPSDTAALAKDKDAYSNW